MTNSTEVAKSGANRMTLYGALAIVLGMLALMAPGLTGISLSILLGATVLIAGIARVIWAFQAGSFGKGIVIFLIGGLTFLCGLALVTDPILGSGMLTIIVAVYFIADGVTEIAAGFQLRPKGGSGWLIFGGMISVLLGFMIWSQFPLSGAWALGVLLGIKLIFIGLIMITGEAAVRSSAVV